MRFQLFMYVAQPNFLPRGTHSIPSYCRSPLGNGLVIIPVIIMPFLLCRSCDYGVVPLSNNIFMVGSVRPCNDPHYALDTVVLIYVKHWSHCQCVAVSLSIGKLTVHYGVIKVGPLHSRSLNG